MEDVMDRAYGVLDYVSYVWLFIKNAFVSNVSLINKSPEGKQETISLTPKNNQTKPLDYFVSNNPYLE
jgi:hypothetical protein